MNAGAVEAGAALDAAARAIESGESVAAVLADARAALSTAGFSRIDYIALCDAGSLAPLVALDRPARLLAAAILGKTRLIDNIAVNP